MVNANSSLLDDFPRRGYEVLCKHVIAQVRMDDAGYAEDWKALHREDPWVNAATEVPTETLRARMVEPLAADALN
jgi:hypothetical protein